MGTLSAAGTKCLVGASAGVAAGSPVVGSDEHFVPKSTRLRSDFVVPLSLKSKRSFLGASTELENLGTERRSCALNSSAGRSQRMGHGFRTRIVGQVLQDSEKDDFHDRHSPSEPSTSRPSCGNGAAMENSYGSQGHSSEGEQEINGLIGREKMGSHQDERCHFRIGRRMLLGAVSVGLTGMYSSSSTAGARATADKGFKFSLTNGSWFLGDSEADLETEGVQLGPAEKESRVYDAAVLGEPLVIGSDSKDKVWTRLLENRVVYLGEAETVADSDDKLLELEIIQTLRDKCFAQKRSVSVAFEAFPCPLQPQLNAYMSKKLTDEELRQAASHISDDTWLEYLPILQYCKSSGVRLVACGAPNDVVRTVEAEGVQALSEEDKRKYIPPAGGGYTFKPSPLDNSGFLDSLPNTPGLFGPVPYRFAQARVVEDYTMAQVVAQIIAEGGAVGLLVVITGASHVHYGARGTGLPAWIAKNKEMQKRTQAVVLLNPERQYLRSEGDVPEADFLWYSAAKVCKRNCFDRAEVARVMGAAGRRRDALPKDLQIGLKQGLVPPEVLESFFELEQNPIMAELTARFQGLRERWFADPRFLERLAIEEAISITTTLIAQFERRGTRFWEELDYVATDTIRGAVVDFFTVWLPAPRLSFRELDPNASFNALESLKGLLGSFPDNAFQRPQAGENWGLGERVGGILVGGLKLFGVGFVSSIGTLAGTNFVLNARQYFSPQARKSSKNKRSPIIKTALVYGSFLGTSANLRYQVIAGVIEHWIADYWLASQPLAGNVLSFAARTANSYFGTAQWVDLARFTGLQAHGDEKESPSSKPALELERISDNVSSSSSVTENHASSIGGNTGSIDQLKEKIEQWVDLSRFTGLQEHGEEKDSTSSKPALEAEWDVERNSEDGSSSSSSSVSENHASTSGEMTGIIDQLKEKLEVPKT
ncbi:unnamed protein product [Calypogeia fissa]